MSVNKKKGISLCSKEFGSSAKSQVKSTSVDQYNLNASTNKAYSIYNTSVYPVHSEESL